MYRSEVPKTNNIIQVQIIVLETFFLSQTIRKNVHVVLKKKKEERMSMLSKTTKFLPNYLSKK